MSTAVPFPSSPLPAPVIRPPWPDELPRLADAFPGLKWTAPLHLRVLVVPATAASPERLVGLAALAEPASDSTAAALFFRLRPRFADNSAADLLLDEAVALAHRLGMKMLVTDKPSDHDLREPTLRRAGFTESGNAEFLRATLAKAVPAWENLPWRRGGIRTPSRNLVKHSLLQLMRKRATAHLPRWLPQTLGSSVLSWQPLSPLGQPSGQNYAPASSLSSPARKGILHEPYPEKGGTTGRTRPRSGRADPPPPLLAYLRTMLHETQKSHGATPFAPIGLTRSGMACWFSLMWIIKESAAMGVPCYLWTLTFRKTYPDSWCGNMHRNLVALLNNDAKRRPQYFSHGFGAVRVTEVHPGGHGIHFHWIVRGRINLAWMRFRAGQCGFGFVFIARDRNFRFRRVDAGAAGYLAKYLVKNGKLHGVRQWSCIGDFEGTKTKDVVFDSRQNRVFRQAYAEAKALKKPPGICWMHAHKVTRHWEHNADDRD